MALNFSKSFSSYIQKEINLLSFLTLNVLTYPLILGIIKSNCLIALSKYPIQYLESVFVLTNFEITILSTLIFQIFIGFLQNETFLLLFLSLQILIYYTMNKKFVIIC